MRGLVRASTKRSGGSFIKHISVTKLGRSKIRLCTIGLYYNSNSVRTAPIKCFIFKKLRWFDLLCNQNFSLKHSTKPFQSLLLQCNNDNNFNGYSGRYSKKFLDSSGPAVAEIHKVNAVAPLRLSRYWRLNKKRLRSRQILTNNCSSLFI